MRKLLILLGAVVFFAAACNSQPTADQTTNPGAKPSQTTAGVKVDAAVNALNKSVDSEDAVYMQSDSDIVDSDKALINSYSGVINASSY